MAPSWLVIHYKSTGLWTALTFIIKRHTEQYPRGSWAVSVPFMSRAVSTLLMVPCAYHPGSFITLQGSYRVYFMSMGAPLAMWLHSVSRLTLSLESHFKCWCHMVQKALTIRLVFLALPINILSEFTPLKINTLRCDPRNSWIKNNLSALIFKG